MRTTGELVIGERVFTIGQLNGREGTRLAPLAFKAGRIGVLNLSPDEIAELRQAFVGSVLLNGKPLAPIYDTVMQGNQLHAIKLLTACIKENYADFFAEDPDPGSVEPVVAPSAE